MIKVKAIILNIRDWRETDRVLTIYTEKHGKIEVLVRGAKKVKSKLAGFCQPFFLLDIFLVKGRNFYHLTGGEIIKQFKGISQSYQKLVLLSRYFNLIDQLIKLEKSEAKIFWLIVGFLEKLEKADLIRAEIIGQAFLIKLLSFLGYRPELKKCLVCGRKIFGWAHSDFAIPTQAGGASAVRMLYFNPRKGGIVCSSCHQPKESIEIEISKPTLNFLQNLLYQEFSFWLGPIKFEKREIDESSLLINNFLEWRA